MKYHKDFGILNDGYEVELFNIDPSEIVEIKETAAIEAIQSLDDNLKIWENKYYECRRQFLKLQRGMRNLLLMKPLVGGKSRSEFADDI